MRGRNGDAMRNDSQMTIDTCTTCETPTHATESNDNGVCAPCLGDAAITEAPIDAHADPATYLSDIPLSLAISAHNGTSMVPEKRGDQECQSYANTLAHDFVMLSKYATTDEKRATLREEFARYRAGFKSRTCMQLLAKSRCLSSMITGPSNFPTRRNGKRSDAADKRTNELIEFRERALDAIRKVLRPELRPIMAGDDNATERMAGKIEALEALQARMKSANEAIRKHAKAGADAQVAALVALGFAEKVARELLKPDFCGRIGFASYELTNNNANIRRLKGRLVEVSAAKVAEVVETKGENATIEDNAPDNRVRLFFPGKPSAEVRERLKGAGFRWAPSLGCWQAYRNNRSIAVARREAGAVESAPVPEAHACPDGTACSDAECVAENDRRAAEVVS